jgi:hypothetical protein
VIEAHILELRLVGERLVPGTVRSKEIAELLEAMEDAIATVVARSDSSFVKDLVIVGVQSIAAGSISLRFGSPHPEPVLVAFRHVTGAVATATYKGLPKSSRQSLSRIRAFARRHDCRAELREPARAYPLAVIDTSTMIAEPEIVYGDTTIYGKVIRVGGRRPRVMIETIAGESVFCDASPAIAKQLAPRLYERVRLEGKAAWDPDSWSLLEFRIREAESGPKEDPSSVIKQLSSRIGGYFSDIGDAEVFSRSVRRGEDV